MPKFKENIYIPVWIDLKGDENYEQICAEHNLHSSMDRFEGIAQQRLFFGISIYIPVWIDLKTMWFIFSTKNLHLHSSMDRFEAYQPISFELIEY